MVPSSSTDPPTCITSLPPVTFSAPPAEIVSPPPITRDLLAAKVSELPLVIARLSIVAAVSSVTAPVPVWPIVTSESGIGTPADQSAALLQLLVPPSQLSAVVVDVV